MSSTTPATAEAMKDTKIDVPDIKVSTGAGLPVHAKLAHLLAVIVSAVVALFVGIVLADGTSVIILKDASALAPITNPALRSQGLNHRADELLGSTYGIGLHHDQAGNSWTDMMAGSTLRELETNLGIPVIIAALPSVIATDDLKHPVPFLKCDALQAMGILAMLLGFIAELAAVVMLILHATALAGLAPNGLTKKLAVLTWFVMSAGFATVVLLATGIYTTVWHCDNSFVPSIKLDEHFNLNYGFYFAIIGLLSCLLIFFTTIVATPMKEGDQSAPTVGKAVTVVGGGVTGGLVLTTVGCVIIMGSNNFFEPAAPVDPTVNPCYHQKPYHAGPNDHYFSNTDCMVSNVAQVLEQAGGNVTRGYVGGLDAGNRVPITTSYSEAGLCPVNVHWHLGTEHLSVGEYDEGGSGPPMAASAYPGGNAPPPPALFVGGRRTEEVVEAPEIVRPWDERWKEGRQLASTSHAVRLGYQCHHYDATDTKFTNEYNWQHCVDMHVGQTYEIHWPHSAAGACGTEWQMQSPFYDGVFCRDGIITIAPLNTYEKIGVQSQVFTIVNDDNYNYDTLIQGARVGGDFWSDVAMYTGSTTGTSRDNQICSRYTPITWQVDRKCHLISARSFDKLCQDMQGMRDDMTSDLHAHGSRALVANQYVANNQQS